MATPRKVREFIAAIEMEANYTALVQGILGAVSLDQLSKGDKEGAQIAELQAKLCERLKAKMIDGVMKIIAEQFTDQELDKLITVYKLPVSVKMRSLLPEISQDVVAMLSDGRVDIDAMINELLAELR